MYSLGMKILIATPLFPPDIGGPATYSRILLKELPKRGIEVKIISFGRVRRFPKVIRHFVYFLLLLKKAGGTDLIYAQDPVSVGLPSLLAARFCRKRFFLKVVGDYAWEQGKQRYGVYENLDYFSRHEKRYPFFVRLHKKIEKRVAEGAEKIIVPSQYLKKIVSNWGISPSKITVIYNTFESPEAFSYAETRRKLNLAGRVLISVGRLVPWKGFGELIGVMPEIVCKFPDATLLIAGDGPERERLEKEIIRLSLQSRVKLLGRLPQRELFEYLSASDVFVLYTGYEGFSHQLLEVLSLGVPIVTTKVGGNPELIENEKEGRLVPYGDKRGFGEAITEVLDNPPSREEMIKRIDKKLSRFSAERMISELCGLLNQKSNIKV